MEEFQVGSHRILQGDVRESLRTLPERCVRMAVTSPPYLGLRSYQTEPQVWGGSENCEHLWGGELPGLRSRWGNTDTLSEKQASNHGSYAMVAALERKAGRYCQLCGAWCGELGAEPTPELFVEHLVEVFREVRRVLTDDGTLWVNIADKYINKRPTMTPWLLALALRQDGWQFVQDIIWWKPNQMPLSVKNRPVPDHEYVLLLSKNPTHYYDVDAVRVLTGRESTWEEYHASLGSNKGADADRYGEGYRKCSKTLTHPLGRARRTVWRVPTKKETKGKHFATFPSDLIRPCILAGSAFGDTVLDPFGGVFTTAVVAQELGRRSIMCELQPDYVQAGIKRLEDAS